MSAWLALALLAAPVQDEPWERMDYGPFVSTAVGLGDGVTPVYKGLVVRLRTRDGEPTELCAVFDVDAVLWRCVWAGDIALRGIVYDGPHGVHPEIEGEPLFRLEPNHDVRVHLTSYSPFGPSAAPSRTWLGLHLDGDDLVFEYKIHPGEARLRERVYAEPRPTGLAFVREVTLESGVQGSRGFRAPCGTQLSYPLLGTADVVTARDATSGALRTTLEVLPHPAPLDDVLASARPRWGAPLTTRGVIDDPLDAADVARRVARPAGSPSGSVVLARGGDGEVELLDREIVLHSTPAPDPFASLPVDARLGWWPSDAGSGSHERNAFRGTDDLRLDGVTWRRGVAGRSLDFDGTAAAWLDDAELDLFEQDLTVAAWIHTTSNGTVFAVAPEDGEWAPDGVTLFLRGGRLAFDVGWVGVVSGGPKIDDGAWHHVAATWRHADGEVRLFVDGERCAEGELPLEGEDDRLDFVARFGWTNANFPEEPRFSGYMDGPVLLGTAVEDDTVPAIAAATGAALVEAIVVRWRGEANEAPTLRLADDAVHLDLPATTTDATYEVRARRGPREAALAWARDAARGTAPEQAFRVDRLTWPDDNPHHSWMRFGAFDFAPSGESAWISTWSGDLWRVDGLDEDLDELRWTRAATGLNQPFGVLAREDEVLVLGRDQITRLHDENGDGEADFLEKVTSDFDNSEHFHEPASGLLAAPDGSLYFVKAARHAKRALHRHHGTLLRVSPDRASVDVVARGFRAPIGLGRLPDGSFLVSDQEGHWTPANRINLVRPSADAPLFYGNGWASGASADDAWEPPLVWLHPTVDRSPSAQLFVDHEAWGPLNGSILGLSYGTGEVYLVLRDDVDADTTQGGVVKLGVRLPTGLLAGQVHPTTGDLYVCGLFGWSSDRTAPGGFYRVRPRPEVWERTLNVPHRMRAREDGLALTFLSPLDPATARDPERWTATAWNYRRSQDYGSATYDLEGRKDERSALRVRAVELSDDGRTALLDLEGFQPVMQLHVTWSIADAAGRPLEHEAHLTVNALTTDTR